VSRALGGVRAVRWGQAAVGFELASPEPAVLARAATVFRPWLAAGAVEPVRRWLAAPAPAGDGAPGWDIHGPTGVIASVPGGPARAVTAVERLAVQTLFEVPGGPVAFHAALVARGARGVLVLGPAEAGKSTLACALWRRGWRLLADDAALVEPDSLAARPAPRRVALREASRTLLGEDLWAQIRATASGEPMADGWVFHPEEVDGRPPSGAVRLAACLFLARRGRPSGAAGGERLEAARALLALLPYASLARQVDPGTAIRRLAPLADAVPAYDLGRGPLPGMVAAVERLVGTEA
jgi:hypothetical protein